VNWLAHLRLTPPTPEGWLGALLGDVVRGPVPAELGADLAAAVTLHRAVDALTASHPAIRRSCARIDVAHGHYRRVLVDVFYDHALARTWPEWSNEPLERFVGRVHTGIDALLVQRPGLAPAFYGPMRDQEWLASYVALDGIATALRRMRRRLRRDHPLEAAVTDLAAASDGFVADFRAFFPDALALAAAGLTVQRESPAAAPGPGTPRRTSASSTRTKSIASPNAGPSELG